MTGKVFYPLKTHANPINFKNTSTFKPLEFDSPKTDNFTEINGVQCYNMTTPHIFSPDYSHYWTCSFLWHAGDTSIFIWSISDGTNKIIIKDEGNFKIDVIEANRRNTYEIEKQKDDAWHYISISYNNAYQQDTGLVTIYIDENFINFSFILNCKVNWDGTWSDNDWVKGCYRWIYSSSNYSKLNMFFGIDIQNDIPENRKIINQYITRLYFHYHCLSWLEMVQESTAIINARIIGAHNEQYHNNILDTDIVSMPKITNMPKQIIPGKQFDEYYEIDPKYRFNKDKNIIVKNINELEDKEQSFNKDGEIFIVGEQL